MTTTRDLLIAFTELGRVEYVRVIIEGGKATKKDLYDCFTIATCASTFHADKSSPELLARHREVWRYLKTLEQFSFLREIEFRKRE